MITKEQIIKIINQSLEMHLDFKDVPEQSTFKDLGIDSLDFYNILIELENYTGKKIDDEDLANLQTLKDLLSYFK